MSFPREQLSETLPTRTHVERAFWKHFAGKRKFRRQFVNALPMRSFGDNFRKRVPVVKMIRPDTSSPRGKGDFDLWQFREILQGKMISTRDSFTQFSKGK